MSQAEDVPDEERRTKDQIADQQAAMHPTLAASLCLKCASHRSIVSGKGSVFMLCQSNETPPSWPKYPPQPLKQCGFFRAS